MAHDLLGPETLTDPKPTDPKPTDLTIETESGAVGLTLTPTHVTMHATDALKQELRDETAADLDTQRSGFAGRSARFVPGSVRGLLERTVGYPLTDIDTVVCDVEALFSYRRKHTLSFEAVRENDRPAATFQRETPELSSQRSISARFRFYRPSPFGKHARVRAGHMPTLFKLLGTYFLLPASYSCFFHHMSELHRVNPSFSSRLNPVMSFSRKMSLPPGRCSSGGVFTRSGWSSVSIASPEFVYMVQTDATPALSP